ncbi:MAG: DUF1587 domain-containing protein, partial [Planctomycetota bacterium]
MSKRYFSWIVHFVVALAPAGCGCGFADEAGAMISGPAAVAESIEPFLRQHCGDCHGADAEAGFSIDELPHKVSRIGNDDPAWAAWELALRRIRTGQMPPPDFPRPPGDDVARFLIAAEQKLDRVAAEFTQPRPQSLRRFTRAQYQNAIRDLLGVDIDASRWLPKDPSSGGFDHITVSTLSPALVSRYVDAAQAIADLALGLNDGPPATRTIRLPADLTQEHRMPGLPPGTRGGLVFEQVVASRGIYRLSVRLTRDRDEQIEGLSGSHRLDVIVGNQIAHRWTIKKPQGGDDTMVDRNLNLDLELPPGRQTIAVTFADNGRGLMEISRQPFDAAYNRHRHPRTAPAIFEVSMVGPLRKDSREGFQSETLARVTGFGEANPTNPDNPENPDNPTSPGRTKILIDRPASGTSDEMFRAARVVLAPILRQAYRRKLEPADWVVPLQFFGGSAKPDTDAALADPDLAFQRGIRAAIASILVNPHFL